MTMLTTMYGEREAMERELRLLGGSWNGAEGEAEIVKDGGEPPPMTSPEPAPSAAPFARAPAPGSYWPLRTAQPRMVSLKTLAGRYVGRKGRLFGAQRSRTRLHAAIDLYANRGDPVIACEDGEVLAFFCFLTSAAATRQRVAGDRTRRDQECRDGTATYALLVRHGDLVMNYGEVDANATRALGLHTPKSRVRAGQMIARVGKNPGGSSMLHFEIYRASPAMLAKPRNIRWITGSPPNRDILDPTQYLRVLQRQGRIAPVGGVTGAPAGATGGGIARETPPAVRRVTPPTLSTPSDEDAKFKRTKYGPFSGYRRFGGGYLDEVLPRLRANGLLSITDEDIAVLQRMSNVETGGVVQGINSYDDSYMSMGFMQLTVKHTDPRHFPDGKLQRLIKTAAPAFARHGIVLEPARRWSLWSGKNENTPRAIIGATNANELRSLAWAKRFWAAGLDPEVIAAEARLAVVILGEALGRIMARKGIGTELRRFYDGSVAVRALMQESYNHRPAWLYTAVQQAMAKARAEGTTSPARFLVLLRAAITAVWGAKGARMKLSAENLIRKTSAARAPAKMPA